jgi:hypothetical protein
MNNLVNYLNKKASDIKRRADVTKTRCMIRKKWKLFKLDRMRTVLKEKGRRRRRGRRKIRRKKRWRSKEMK